MMVMTEVEVAGLLQFAVRHTATRLGIGDVEWKCIEELLDEMHSGDATTHSLLVTFIDAYLDWYRFHKDIDRVGKTGDFDASERARLGKLIANRDKTRQAILARLRELPQ